MNNYLTKILILAANPLGTSQLRLDEEVREIDEGLRRASKRDEFILEQRWAVRLRDLRRAILDVSPHLVHFCGHGETEGLVLEDSAGSTQVVSAAALSNLFALFAGQIRCVLLNACYSTNQAQAISEHIDYVIGMRKEIGDEAAIEFAVGFYDALAAGRSIEDAFKFGQNAIELEGIPETLTPRIHVRPKDKAASESSGKAPAETAAPTKSKPIEIFYSYAHEDEELRNRLEKHLSGLRRQNIISTWNDRQIGAGDEWRGKIDEHLNTSQMILLLISEDFLASDYCYDVEMKRAMERHEAGEARVIPVILRECDWQHSPFAKLQALPKDAKPVKSWPSKDEAFTNVAKGIRAAVEAMRG
jgi:TIR domain/CHAT domain